MTPRAEVGDAPGGGEVTATAGEPGGGAALDVRLGQITALQDQASALLTQARSIRSALDARASGTDPDPTELERLNGLRTQQIPIWDQLRALLQQVVEGQTGRGAGGQGRRQGMAPPPAHSAALEAVQDRVSRLHNWRDRQRLSAIASELHQQPANQEALEAERGQLVSGMEQRFHRMSQGDRRWGREAFRGNGAAPASGGEGGAERDDRPTLYNQGPTGHLAVATIQAGGCGALSLAMVLEFQSREDPEAEAVTDLQLVHTATDAISAMRARGQGGTVRGQLAGGGSDAVVSGRSANGTDWGRISSDIGDRFANLRGRAVGVSDIRGVLDSGEQVVWLKHAPEHFVVISRYDERNNTRPFHVSDPGYPDANVALDELRTNNRGFWTLRRAY